MKTGTISTLLALAILPILFTAITIMGGEMEERRFKKIIYVLLVLFVTADCAQKPPDIQVSDTVAVISRLMQGVASVSMRISNHGGRDDNLISVGTDIDGTIVELHDVKDGKMVKVKSIKIPSHSKIWKISSGLHIIIFKLPDEIKEGSEFTLHLRFEEAGEKAVGIKILKNG